jgi:hypothetical protein
VAGIARRRRIGITVRACEASSSSKVTATGMRCHDPMTPLEQSHLRGKQPGTHRGDQLHLRVLVGIAHPVKDENESSSPGRRA